jgi:hypothetical protein
MLRGGWALAQIPLVSRIMAEVTIVISTVLGMMNADASAKELSTWEARNEYILADGAVFSEHLGVLVGTRSLSRKWPQM